MNEALLADLQQADRDVTALGYSSAMADMLFKGRTAASGLVMTFMAGDIAERLGAATADLQARSDDIAARLRWQAEEIRALDRAPAEVVTLDRAFDGRARSARRWLGPLRAIDRAEEI